jgi:hypothetical protein
MASKAKVGRGTIVSIGGVTGTTGGGAETFVVIEELMGSPFSGGVWGTEDVTNFQSGVDDEFISTTRNNGEVTLKGNLIDGAPGQAALNAAYNSGSKYDFKVQLLPGPGETTGTLYTFSALVTTFFDIDVSVRAAIQFSAKLKVSGEIVTVEGS